MRYIRKNKHKLRPKYGKLITLFVILVLVGGMKMVGGMGRDDGRVPEGWTNAHVTRVKDGDSVVVKMDGRQVEVRLWGIDAPEYRQPYSNKSKQFLKKLIEKEDVMIKGEDVDKYDRLVAVVKVGDTNINETMVKEGLAWVHIYFCKKAPCDKWQELQEKAKERGVGLW